MANTLANTLSNIYNIRYSKLKKNNFLVIKFKVNVF